MSDQKIDGDGFKIVPSKKAFKKKHTKIPQKDTGFNEIEPNIDVNKALSRIRAATDELRNTNYLEQLTVSVSNVVNERKLDTIVCFGLGHIGECIASRYQLALLLCIKDFFSCSEVVVHDPVFYKSECLILKELDLQVLLENSEGGYVIPKQSTTLVYLPHCPKQLTNNFLWSNWSDNLQNCILICNSFSSLIENQPSRILNDTVPFIVKINQFVTEIVLKNDFKHTDIFNDTSIHYFPKEKLEKVDSIFWDRGTKPVYEDNEEFITSLMVEKLNI